eukprot:364347-Chlamydomonas_euryale.AAC.22
MRVQLCATPALSSVSPAHHTHATYPTPNIAHLRDAHDVCVARALDLEEHTAGLGARDEVARDVNHITRLAHECELRGRGKRQGVEQRWGWITHAHKHKSIRVHASTDAHKHKIAHMHLCALKNRRKQAQNRTHAFTCTHVQTHTFLLGSAVSIPSLLTPGYMMGSVLASADTLRVVMAMRCPTETSLRPSTHG